MSVDPKKLKKRVEDRREARARDMEAERHRTERLKIINAAYDHTPMQFWCDECRKDYDTTGHKVVQAANKYHEDRAYYVGICPVGHRNIRRITDKLGDPYYYKSEMIRRQRIDLADAMLQPHDPRFRQVYPAQWRKMEEEREAREQAAKEEMPLRL